MSVARLRRPAAPPHRRDDNDELDEGPFSAEKQPCPTCKESGHCPTCDGTGEVLPREALGALLREKRLETNVSLRALAREMAITATHLGDLELGQRRITTDMRRRYLAALKECGG